MFSDLDYNPITANVGTSGTWKKQLITGYNVWDWTCTEASWTNAFNGAFQDVNNTVDIIDAGDTSNLTSLNSTFRNCPSLTSVCLFDTSNVSSFQTTFASCSSLVSVPEYDTTSLINVFGTFLGCTSLKKAPAIDLSRITSGSGLQQAFDGCTSLESVPNYNFENAIQCNYMFRNCSRLTTLPLFVMTKITSCTGMFSGCVNVESGALDLYNMLSTKDVEVTTHTGTFTNCGANTVTGAAELAQIPSSWGGTGV